MFSIVLIDYYSYNKTINFINHLISKNKTTKIDFIIVDNSVDIKNSRQLLHCLGYTSNDVKIGSVVNGLYKNVRFTLIINNSNNGYGPGANIGIKYALEKNHSSYIIVSNNDLKILNDDLELDKVIKIFEKDDGIGLIGPSIIGLDGKAQTPCKFVKFKNRWIIPFLMYPFNSLIKADLSDDLLNINVEEKVYRIMGAFMIFNGKAVKDINGFDEGTFLFAEENIIAERLIKKGYSTLFYPNIKLLHEHNQTIGNFYNKREKLIQRFKSESYYYNKYMGVSRIKIFIGKISMYSFIIKKSLVHMLKGDKT